MINLRQLAIVLLSTAIFGCGGEKTETTTSSEVPDNLIGTWKLKQRIDHANGATEWADVSDTVVYDKYLTDTHFTWINYDKGNDVLLGIGGGRYEYDGQNYVEHIEFFMPPSAGILGQSINFKASFTDGDWNHTGYSKQIEFDPETAQHVVVDSNRIEEIWYKVAPGSSSGDLVGTWELKEQRLSADQPAFDFPDFVNYVKHVTPSHFIWVQYNDEGDVVSGAGSGTYSYDGSEYTEMIEMMYPPNVMLGGKYTFTCELDDNKQWTHFCTAFEKTGMDTTVYIDEKWIPISMN